MSVDTLQVATRKLAADRGDADELVAAVRTLADSEGPDQRVVRALILGLSADEPAVRDACESALNERFRASDADTRRFIMSRLFVTLTGNVEPPDEAVSLLTRLIDWVRRNRSKESHLFGMVLLEAERAREGSYPRQVSRALKRLYDASDAETGRSAELIERFNRRQAIHQLRDETAPSGEVVDDLQTLGRRPLSETSFEVVLSHLFPLLRSSDPNVLDETIGNLQEWTAELPGTDRFDLSEAVEELDAYRRGLRNELPTRIRNEYALSEVGAPELEEAIERFREVPKYEHLLVPMIEILDETTGARSQIDTLREIALDETDEPQDRAIESLRTFLTGLDADADHNDRYISRAYDDDVASTDGKVRETLQTLATAEPDSEAAAAAVEELVRSRPDDVDTRLAEVLSAHSVTDPVARSAIEAVAEESVVEATDAVLDAFDASEDDGSVELLSSTLEALGHDPARRKLRDVMEGEEGDSAGRAQESLIKSGYYEQVREFDTRQRSEAFAEQSETANERRQEAKDERREAKRRYKDLETELRETVFEADQTLRSGYADILEKRIDSVDTLVELYTADRRMQRILDRATGYQQALDQYLGRIVFEEDIGDGVSEELASIEQGLDRLSRLADVDRQRASELEDRIDTLGRESPPPVDGDEADMELRAELEDKQRSVLRRLSEAYREAASEWDQRSEELRAKFEGKASDLRNQSIDPVSSDSIDGLIREARSCSDRIDRLQQRRQQEWGRVDEAVVSHEESVVDVLDTLLDVVGNLERTQQEIDDLTKHISDLQLEQQHTGQWSRQETESYDELEPIARGEARRQAEIAGERAAFYKHRHIYESLLRRQYEMHLERIDRSQLDEDRSQQLAELEAELGDAT